MNILITGDTHGDLSHILAMYDAMTSDDTLEGIPHVDNFDCLIHTGDYKKDAFELGKKLGLEVYSAFGNCDDYWEPDFDILDTDAGSIVITHGHIEDVNNTHTKLYELAQDQGCNCICYGHTHIPCYEEENGYLVINPGSPTKPLDGTKGSCAVLTADEDGYHGQIVYYEDVEAAVSAAAETEAPAEAEAAPAEAPAEAKDEAAAPAEAIFKKPAPKKSTGFGGFLRKIFNYSDGQ